ncbi:hypothetical protein GCM10010913_43530 [Paenibacillus aceti]|uniref:Cupin type-2 domain-containing protein n=1 Tax=Paenibacillus aceti TaxID=1820010 RepID=A0ABQ1W8N1_9BACL|nr:cupin domain-containing protein [Paenibacillus aceti]GGG16757.1 hypothetical protein GCM10010913_43530 [Paenibacillus aceti]
MLYYRPTSHPQWQNPGPYQWNGYQQNYYGNYVNPYYPQYHPNQQPWNNAWDQQYRVHELKDYGPRPFVVDIEEATKKNTNYRTAIWTGNHLQVTLMSINVGDDIGLEVHPNVDQFLRIEDGKGIVQMGPGKDNLNFQEKVDGDYAIVVPAGTWHNVINTGNKPLKLYTIYAPPHHPHGTVHHTKAVAQAEEGR